MPLPSRTAAVALGCALALPVLPALPATAAEPWSDPQTITTTPASNPATAVAETAEGTLVAITREASGDFRRSARVAGADWVPGGVFADPDGFALTYVQAIAVTPDGAGWLAYSVDDEYADSDVVRIVRWAPDGTSEVLDAIIDPWTIVDLSVDAESDVLLTYGERGGYPLAAVYGNAVDGLGSLDVPSWTGGQRPHQWVLGPGADVMLVSRFANRLRTVDVGPGGDGRTRTLGRTGAGLTDEVAAAIAPSGAQYVAWTTSRKAKPSTVRLARRSPDGAWKSGRVVDRRGKRARPQQSLTIRTTKDRAYLAWTQLSKRGSTIRGAVVRRKRPVLTQLIAGPRAVGNLGNHRFALDVDQRGRLLAAWTQIIGSERRVGVALGRVRGRPCVTQLFDVARLDSPVALLRAEGEATVAGSSPSATPTGPVVWSVSTD